MNRSCDAVLDKTPSLFDGSTPPTQRKWLSNREKFEQFHAQNPEVYRQIVREARKLKAAGWRHFGIAAIFEALRYRAALRTANDSFKLNNNFRSFYARLIMREYPDLDGFFRVRGA